MAKGKTDNDVGAVRWSKESQTWSLLLFSFVCGTVEVLKTERYVV